LIISTKVYWFGGFEAEEQARCKTASIYFRLILKKMKPRETNMKIGGLNDKYR